MSSDDVAEIAIDGMFNKKEIIVPSAKLRVLLFMKRFVSRSFIAHEAYGFQKSNKLWYNLYRGVRWKIKNIKIIVYLFYYYYFF